MPRSAAPASSRSLRLGRAPRLGASPASRIWRTRLSFSVRRRISSVRRRARPSSSAVSTRFSSPWPASSASALARSFSACSTRRRASCVGVRIHPRPHLLSLAPCTGEHVGFVGLALLGSPPGGIGGLAPGFGRLPGGPPSRRGALLGGRRLLLAFLATRPCPCRALDLARLAFFGTLRTAGELLGHLVRGLLAPAGTPKPIPQPLSRRCRAQPPFRTLPLPERDPRRRMKRAVRWRAGGTCPRRTLRPLKEQSRGVCGGKRELG